MDWEKQLPKTVRIILLLALFEFESFGLTTSAAGEFDTSFHGATYFVAPSGDDSAAGTINRPWATINHAAKAVQAGDLVVVRGGRYGLSAQVRPKNSGRSDAWITFAGYPGEKPILDAERLPHSMLAPQGLDNGAFQIEGVSHIRVANLTIINSHDAGFTIRDSNDIDLINNSIEGTYSSGIAVWDTNHDGKGTERIRIIGNTITKATTWNLFPQDIAKPDEPPHEALSIGGAVEFEVAYNHIYDSDKEGIDIKQTSKRGKVHHNYVHHIDRQGIYVDAAFGSISDIDVFSNVIHDCGAGVIISVEGGQLAEKINVRSNLIFNNKGSGLYFSPYGVNGARRKIKISNNIFYRNGHGEPKAGQTYYWMPGGLYLYSTNVNDISVQNNVFSGNSGFQIGYSELFLTKHRSWRSAALRQKIQVKGNLIHGQNTVEEPITGGGNPPFRVKIYAINGSRAILADPFFKDPANENFVARPISPRLVKSAANAIYGVRSSQPWWKQSFPPTLVRTCKVQLNEWVCFTYP